jgi:hypothetical protein
MEMVPEELTARKAQKMLRPSAETMRRNGSNHAVFFFGASPSFCYVPRHTSAK